MSVNGLLNLQFPKLNKIILKNFSIYSSQPEITIEFPSGVVCLAGANGIGKSTFLNIINYAITGLVDSDRKFNSVEEYYRNNKNFPSEYFSGRVNELDREASEVYIELKISDKIYKLTRGFFEPEELRSFCLYRNQDLVLDCSNMTPGERHKEYIKSIVKDVGVETFEQFVFIQLFLLTFGERRHLLFWDQKVLEQALYLAFGVDYSMAKHAEKLRREAEKADSLARNASWQAGDLRKKIEFLQNAINNDFEIKEEERKKILEQYKRLQDELESKLKLRNELDAEKHHINLKLAEFTSKELALQNEYKELFTIHAQQGAQLLHHPLIKESINSGKCELCGNKEDVATRIKAKLESHSCPLCDSKLNRNDDKMKRFKQLQRIDEELLDVKERVKELGKKINRLDRERDIVEIEVNNIKEEISKFEQDNENVIRSLEKGRSGNNVNIIIESYVKTMNELIKKKTDKYKLRDEKRKELRKLQQKLEKNYSSVEEHFVPSFRELAQLFLGIDLDIRMETSSQGVNLVLEVRSTARRQHYQLSESQKFFIDIALRMALVQQMSSEHCKASLLIDTPEGSLDIAYESRAGNMFARFVENGFNIIMSANINSSQLLQSLAKKCGRSKMVMIRMTSWTELSDVQVAEENLFKKAYNQVQEALNEKEA
jgi:DNA repair exonuclease SbcCD ATPase subunit